MRNVVLIQWLFNIKPTGTAHSTWHIYRYIPVYTYIYILKSENVFELEGITFKLE